MRPSKFTSLHLSLLLLALGFLFACHLTTSSETEQTFTFPALADSVAGADQVTILLKDTSGNTLDVLFDGPLTAATSFKSLNAPHYRGGTVRVIIEAKKDGQVIYAVKQTYDGEQGKVTQSTTVVARAPSVRLAWPTPRLREGDSLPFPPVTVLPRSLENPSVRFVSRAPSRLRVGKAHLHALLKGQAILVAMLSSDTAVRDSVEVEVLSKDVQGLARLTLSPKPLNLALRGPEGRFTVEAEPQGVEVELLWSALHASIVSASPDGLLTPMAEGQGRIVVASKWDAGVADTAWVHVLPPQKVDSVRFEQDSLEVFVGGTPDSLTVHVHPPLAPPGVAFSLADSTLAQLQGGKVVAHIEGETWVHARSVEDPTQRDSLRLLVFPKEGVDSVRVKPDTLRLYVQGPKGALTASIHPTTLQGRFSWSVTDPAIASVDGSGQVSPGAPGKTYVTASARADASKRDSALVRVVKDTPRLSVGGDTVVSVGITVTHHLQVTQEFGEVVLFRWDLDGDGAYDDSATAVPAALTYTYTQPQVHTARFHVRDSEGNDTTVFRKVSAVEGRVVQIVSPRDSSYTNQGQIVVSWRVDGEPFTNAETLSPGANTVTRSAQDEAGHTVSHSVTVFLDQVAPSRPIVSGPAVPVNTLTPSWSWTSGGGGNGLFRLRLDDPDLTASIPSPDTFFTAPQNLPGGAHTLYVQERDEAGNWSLSGSFAIRIDTTAPSAPTVRVNPTGVINNPRPTWSWTGGMGDAYRTYRFKLGDDDFRSGGQDTVGTSYQPPALSEGTHSLFVQARDSAGNWSASASASVTVDLTAPTPPHLDSMPYSPLNSLRPRWTWRSGMGGAKVFRAKVDDPNLAGAVEQTDTSYTPAENLSEGSHTLYVQERDNAGNWSLTSSRTLTLALSGPIGTEVPRRGTLWNFSMKLDGMGIPFIAFMESGEAGNKVVVMRYNGSEWREIPLMQCSGFHGPSLALNKEGYPSVAFADSCIGGHVRTMIYGAYGWKNLGQPSISKLSGWNIRLAFDKNDIPLVAFRDGDRLKVAVKRLQGEFWQPLGEAEYMPWGSESDFDLSIIVDSANTPHVSRVAFGEGFVETFDGNSWAQVVKVSDYGGYGKPALAFGKSNLPLIAFQNIRDRKLSVMSRTIDGWGYLGNSGISDGRVDYFSIASDRGGHVYAAYSENVFGENWVTVMKFENGNWLRVGKSRKANEVRDLSLEINPSGVPIVAINEIIALENQVTIYKASFDH